MFRTVLSMPPAMLCIAMLFLAKTGVANANTAELRMTSNGHFVTMAEINGSQIEVMVDTGATTVALSYEDAQAAGFEPDELSYKVPVSTANGTVMAARVSIDSIEIDGIFVDEVEGMVLPEGALSGSLLGNSFLRRLHSYEVMDGILLLRN